MKELTRTIAVKTAIRALTKVGRAGGSGGLLHRSCLCHFADVPVVGRSAERKAGVWIRRSNAASRNLMGAEMSR